MKKIKSIILGFCLVLGCFLISAIPANAELHEDILVEDRTDFGDYVGKDTVPTPNTPVEGVEYKFAGWFTDESCSKDSALTTDFSGETAYAKFIPAEVLGVQAQVLGGTMFSSKKTSIRFVTTIDSLEYESVGFEFVINGNNRVSDPITTVYRKLCGIGDAGEVLTYEPNTEFHDASKYFYTWTVYNVPNVAFGQGIKARPYLVTPDGTTVYGDWETKTVNMGYIPDVIGSDLGKLYDMTAPTLDGYDKCYLQGGCTDGTYYYQAFVYGNNAKTIIYKYDKDGALITQSEALDLGHGSDLTYNSKTNQLVICHYTSALATADISFLNLETFAVEKTVDTKNTYAISYNELTDKYVIGYNVLNGNLKFAITDSEFNILNEHEFNTTTNNLTPQGVASDDSYIYFLYYRKSDITSSYEGHVIAVYDWDGAYVGVIEIPVDDIPLSYEPENISVIDNEMYISCLTGNGTATIYKINYLETKYEALIGSVYYETLADAIDKAKSGDRISILKDISIDKQIQIADSKSLTIKNLAGEEIEISRGDSLVNHLFQIEDGASLTLECAEGGFVLDGTSASAISGKTIRVESGGTFILGDDVVLQNANSSGNGSAVSNVGTAKLYGVLKNNCAAGQGGAVYSTGILSVKDAKFTDNYSTGNQGGAVYHQTGQIQVDGCTFNGNYTTQAHGGAMYIKSVTTSESAPSYIQNSVFYKNAANGTETTKTSGGAIAFEGTTLSITDCQFGGTDKDGNLLGNTAYRRAGAIYQTGGGTITITSTTKQHVFANNTCGEAFGTNAGGGALYSNKGTIRIIGYAFENNLAKGEKNNWSVTTKETDSESGHVILEDCLEYEAQIGGTLYDTLEEAVAAAHEDTTSETVEIILLGNVELSSRLNIYRNIVLKNDSGKDVVIKGNFVSPQLIRVWEENDVTCTFEIGGTEEGSITIDGTGRTTGASLIRNDAGCTLTLGANVAVVNGGATSNGNGAALYNLGTANLYCDFTGNDATKGGAVYNEDTGSVNIYGGTYSGNTAKEYGGAIYSKGILKVNNATFTENYVTSYQGGAIYHTAKQIQIDGCTFNGNYTTANHGGAMYVKGVTTSTNAPSYIQNTEFYKNSAGGTSSSGGAVAFEGTTLSIKDCQFGGTDEEGNSLGNIAGRRAGAIYQTGGGTITITSTTKQHVFANNTCGEAFNTSAGGGALYSNNGTMNVTGYIFENNKAAGTNNDTSITADSGNIVLNEIPIYEAKIGNAYYSTFAEAVTAAHADTTSEKVEITVLGNVVLSARQDIKRDMVIKNLSGKDVVISGDFVTPQLIRVWEENDVTCTLEIGGTEEGSITIDGTGRTTGASLIRNDVGCTLTLGENVAVVNGGATSDGNGAALYNLGTANLYCDFTGNDATKGGAIYNEDTGSVNIYGGTYSGNTAKQYGGAIFSKGILKVANATFTENYVTSYQGGAIYHTAKQIQIDGCTFNGNYTTANHGGAMYVKGVTTSTNAPSYIQNTEFYKNSAGGTSSSGGAVAFEGTTLSITDCQFGGTDEEGNSLGNIAGRRAGAIYQTVGGTITITSTTKQHVFANNTCGEAFGKDAGGGALYSNSGTMNVTGYIFENNKAAGENNNTSITSSSGAVNLTDCTEK